MGRPLTEEETAKSAELMRGYAGHGEYNPIGSERDAKIA